MANCFDNQALHLQIELYKSSYGDSPLRKALATFKTQFNKLALGLSFI